MTYFQTIISVKQLHSLFNNRTLKNYLVIFDCRFSLTDAEKGKNKYDKQHIPQAIYVNLDYDLTGEIQQKNGRHPLPNRDIFIHKLQNWGVNKQSQVVVYDDTYGSIASRMWWMLRWAGYKNVALLDGGYPAWVYEKFPISQKKYLDYVKSTPEAHENENLDMQIQLEDLINAMNVDELQLFDARSAVRFCGEKEPIDQISGHIPGAKNLPFEDNLDENGFFLEPKKLRQRFKMLLSDEYTNDRTKIVNMCGSGVTACHNILAMEIASIQNTKLYVGSWSEWILDHNRPIALGSS